MKFLVTIFALLLSINVYASETVCIDEDDNVSLGLGFVDGNLSLGSFLYSSGGLNCYRSYTRYFIIEEEPLIIYRGHGYVHHRSAHRGRHYRHWVGSGRPGYHHDYILHKGDHPAYHPRYKHNYKKHVH